MLIRIFILLIITFELFHAQEDKVVAEVGNYKIYESEFKERFDFSVHPNLLQKKDSMLIKQEFLNQLIAEKLLSLNAREKGYDTLEVFKNIISPLRNMFVRDALYEREVKNKASYSNDEIKEGVERIKKLLKVKFIYSKDREELKYIYSQLEKGASFDSLLSLRPEVKNQKVPRTITFGTMEKEIEDSVYNLGINEFTAPLESKDGYYILKLTGIENNPELKSGDNVLEDVKRIVEARATYKSYLRYYRNFFSSHRAAADKEIFEKLTELFITKFKEKYSNQISGNDKYFLRGYDEVSSVLQFITPDLAAKNFINLGEKQVKLKYFVNQLSQDGLFVKDLSDISIRASLSSYIRKFIEDELLTDEGIRRGLENIPDVQKYMRMWEDSYLSKMLMVNMFDSLRVSDEEAYSLYKEEKGKNIPVEMVNIAEVLNDSLSVIETVMNELAKGKDIKELARKYTQRDSLKERGGVFGYFPVFTHGELGRKAAQMKIGDVCGPIKLDEGYSVFQLIDKKQDTTGKALSYNDVKERLVMQVTLKKFEKYVNEYNARLALKYGVKINEDVLKGIEDIFMNLVVVRYMGFGGEIFAVPYTEQFSGWYDIWQQSKNIAQ